MAEVFANRAESTLAAGIALGAVSLSVQAGHGAKFPATGDFSILLQDASDPNVYEFVKATARAVDTITITATTMAWDPGDKVVAILDKRVMDQLVADIAGKQALSEKGAASGYAPLGADSKVPAANLPSLVGAKVYRTSDQTITNNTFEAIAFDNETFDSDGFHDNATNNTRITIPAGKGGKYRVRAAATWNGNATGKREITIRKNGSGVAYRAATPNASYVTSELIEELVLVATDYLEVFVRQDSGGSLTVTSGGIGDPQSFSVEFMGA